ncbi:ABC transporter ATP-binding protein [Grimontia hollisae]|uniref:ABC efflux transporter ATP-binding protein n=1 Tax=Grimontia hollisae CIP 101886 TaxID=675812 RepID=D0I8N5_GRIHO|nr:ATP-binding cassette domain-containing protein [Grimontia hollisae]AMG30897.1 ABC transporter ATP-binding protein [Grimontia hollisae]EEY73004.1 ABC efflux transporter ATP-binding protein [Grimontia hollisae CIP 101886]MDF2183218.1 ATP-binding cassette domain-containing protein [Grimontia hollisae]STO47166.1 Daunorubicin/doxorubicin resistance ATP-binding protein DrrA [Grimontia hollisae]
MINIDGLSHHYGPRCALSDLTLTLGRGLHMLLGPNGAGKSTLFSLLARLTPVQQGNIRLLGEPPSRQTMARLGMVFQQSTLDLDLTVGQNLSYYGALHGYSKTQSLKKAAPLLTHFSLTDRLNDTVRTLNGGHRRRTELVRALMHAPSILLLDEPTSGLDPKARASLSEAVRSLCAQQPLCVLWATHLIEEVDDQDNVLILHRGRLRAHNTASELRAEYRHSTLAGVFATLTSDNAGDD